MRAKRAYLRMSDSVDEQLAADELSGVSPAGFADDFVQIAEVDGIPAAMIVAIPSVNEVIRDLDGRLLPFGWLKLLWLEAYGNNLIGDKYRTLYQCWELQQ